MNVKTLESDGTILFQPEVIDKDETKTCNGDVSNCPCAEHYFSIKGGNEDTLFTINPTDGSISLTKGSSLLEGHEYMIELSVRNKIVQKDDKDGKAIVLFRANRAGWYMDPINSLIEQENDGYSHHIVKRVAPAVSLLS